MWRVSNHNGIRMQDGAPVIDERLIDNMRVVYRDDPEYAEMVVPKATASLVADTLNSYGVDGKPFTQIIAELGLLLRDLPNNTVLVTQATNYYDMTSVEAVDVSVVAQLAQLTMELVALLLVNQH